MKLETLTPYSTEIWISNANKTAQLYNAVQAYMNSEMKKRRDQFESTVLTSKWKRFWYSVDSWYDVCEGWDGQFRVYGLFSSKPLKEIESLSYMFISMKDHIMDDWIGGGKKEKLRRTIITWEKYAQRPFEISTTDMETYLDLWNDHKELKKHAEYFGIYDETFDLDEDCV